MGLASGKMDVDTTVSGLILQCMAKVSTSGATTENTKETSFQTKDMVKEFKQNQMETSMTVTGKMENNMEQEG